MVTVNPALRIMRAYQAAEFVIITVCWTHLRAVRSKKAQSSSEPPDRRRRLTKNSSSGARSGLGLNRPALPINATKPTRSLTTLAHCDPKPALLTVGFSETGLSRHPPKVDSPVHQGAAERPSRTVGLNSGPYTDTRLEC